MITRDVPSGVWTRVESAVNMVALPATAKNVRSALKVAKLCMFYEYARAIADRLNGQHVPVLSDVMKGNIIAEFKRVHSVATENLPCCFLARKICMHIGAHELVEYFSELKSVTKREQLEKVWINARAQLDGI